MAGTPNYPKNLGDQFTDLRRKAKEAFTSGNTREALDKIQAAALDVFGQLIIRPGGKLIAKYKNGGDALSVGAHTLADGTPVHGVVIRRPGGQTAVWVFGYDNGAPGFFAVYDLAGNIIVSDDAVSGQGLATPYIGWSVTPWSEVLTPPQSTTSATWVQLHRAHGPKQHPRVKVLLITQSDASTTGQVRLRNAATGDIIAGPIDLPAADNAYRTLEGPLAGGHMGDVYLDVEAQRTGGAGAIRVGVAYLEGKQS